jgi:2-polyprenyl-3-methyl-5-hydroxy-6-metoxy-1,4-benzoquinol methylase
MEGVILMTQNKHSKLNEEAWNQLAYDAWVYRFGFPKEAAEKIKKDPEARLSSLYKYFGKVKGKKIINLLGSHGGKAVALALLGAEATVVDIASENERYAKELAEAAGVNIKYIISDVLKMPKEEILPVYDVVFAELGVLHYFTDLAPFMRLISKLLIKDGKLILQDFHPVSTKLITSRGNKHKVTGDYFDESLEEVDVAYLKFIPGIENLPEDQRSNIKKAYLRKWTLGEVITAVANSGLFIQALDEDENSKPDDKGIPKIFTIVAKKI